MQQNRILVVTGMHRSGTSVVTQWLNKCGLPVGDDLLGAGIGNEDGHYEDNDFFRVHRSLLKMRRLSEDGYTQPVRNLSCEELDTLAGIIQFKNDLHPSWGWKDPRTCLFLDSYQALIPNGYYLVVLRDWRSVVSSLIHRIYQNTVNKYAAKSGVSKFLWDHLKQPRRLEWLKRKHSEQYLRVWVDYNEAIAEHIAALDTQHYLVVDFDQLPGKSAAIFAHLAHHWNFPLSYVDFQTIYRQRLVHPPMNIERYVKDARLLERAFTIEQTLRALIPPFKMYNVFDG